MTQLKKIKKELVEIKRNHHYKVFYEVTKGSKTLFNCVVARGKDLNEEILIQFLLTHSQALNSPFKESLKKDIKKIVILNQDEEHVINLYFHEKDSSNIEALLKVASIKKHNLKLNLELQEVNNEKLSLFN
ncbi:hypothetical protein [Mycoplasmopsis sturni]|uniref:hypothetical protein n=1 Tax=Mycoplasmopsis sturni TaxID=39047 RepID=UPI00056C8FDD|nr:hypothetical protein [Mycoplasmopsis sturni]